MFLREVKRENKSGTVRYLQLAHNEWDPARPGVADEGADSFGREDELDRAAIERLVAALSRLLDPADGAGRDRAGRAGVR